MDQVRPSSGNLIVHPPRTGQLAGTSLFGRLEGEEGDNISRVGVEDLFVGGVGRAPNDFAWIRVAEILYVRQDNVCGLPVKLVILAASLRGDVGRQSRVDDDILLPSVLIDIEAADDEESVATVQLI